MNEKKQHTALDFQIKRMVLSKLVRDGSLEAAVTRAIECHRCVTCISETNIVRSKTISGSMSEHETDAMAAGGGDGLKEEVEKNGGDEEVTH